MSFDFPETGALAISTRNLTETGKSNKQPIYSASKARAYRRSQNLMHGIIYCSFYFICAFLRVILRKLALVMLASERRGSQTKTKENHATTPVPAALSPQFILVLGGVLPISNETRFPLEQRRLLLNNTCPQQFGSSA